MSKSLLHKVADHSLFKKEAPIQLFSCEFSENFKSTIFTEHFRTTGKKEHLFPEDLLMVRGSHFPMLYDIGVLKYFVKFTAKQLHRSLFSMNKVADWTCPLKKEALSKEICEILGTVFF